MPEEDPTFATVGEDNIRERAERTGEPLDYYLNYLDRKYENGD